MEDSTWKSLEATKEVLQECEAKGREHDLKLEEYAAKLKEQDTKLKQGATLLRNHAIKFRENYAENTNRDRKLTRLDQKVNDHMARFRDQMAEIERDAHIALLCRLNKDYLQIRERRIDVFRRDILHNLDSDGPRSISLADEVVDDGDATSDASLYTTGTRTDEDTFKELYGVDAKDVVALEKDKKFRTIRLLNAWSTRVSRVGKDGVPSDVRRAFETFLEVLKKNLGADPYDEKSELTRACNRFWNQDRKYER